MALELKRHPQRIDEQPTQDLHARLMRYCLSLTKSRQDAEDLAQDAWVKALNHQAIVKHLNQEALLVRIAKNAWIDGLRRESAFEHAASRASDLSESRHDPSDASEPLDASLGIEVAFSLLMESLSPKQRSVFVMRDVFGFSVRETARRLQTSEGGVKTALHRARQNLDAIRHSRDFGEISLTGKTSPDMKDLVEAYIEGNVTEVLRLLQVDVAMIRPKGIGKYARTQTWSMAQHGTRTALSMAA